MFATSKILNDEFNLKKNLKILCPGNKIYLMKLQNVYFQDSYLMTRMSLNNLGMMLFKEGKDKFDVTKNTYEDLRPVFLNKRLNKKFKDYNIQDSQLLYKCMKFIQNEFFDLFQLDFTNYLTSSSLAKNVFKTYYYNLPTKIFLKVDYKNTKKEKRHIFILF